MTSWKEIAQFLGVSVRSAQRYETEMGLPVRRLGGDKGRAVAASVADLVEWRKRNVAAPRFWQDPRFLRWNAVGATVVILAMSVPLVRDAWERWKVGKPYASSWYYSTLVATDQQGREVWRRGFPAAPLGGLYEARFHGDLDGDGRVETLVPYVSHRRDSEGAFIHCISEDGEELWKIEPRRAVSDRANKFTDVYVYRDYKVFPSPEKDRTQWTAAIFAHHFEYPSVAVVVDGKGKTRGEYWHSGHLESVHVADLDKDEEAPAGPRLHNSTIFGFEDMIRAIRVPLRTIDGKALYGNLTLKFNMDTDGVGQRRRSAAGAKPVFLSLTKPRARDRQNCKTMEMAEGEGFEPPSESPR